MKKVIVSLLLISSFVPASFAQQTKAKPQLSAFTRKYLNDAAHATDKTAPMPGFVYKNIGGNIYVSAFVRVNESVDDAAISALGVLTGTKAGNIWTVQIPVENITTFTQLNGISNIDLDMPVTPMLDQAKKATKADSAQGGYGLSYPLAGQGVLVGIIDAGFDFTHPTLYDTSHSSYRVKKVWRQKVNGTPPVGYAYGNEISDPYLIRANRTDTGITPHGTHVAGIAAGSGYGSPSNKYRGMAFKSDMAVVCIMPAPYQWAVPGTSDIIDGMNYLFNYAQSVFKPCIVNLSWGSSIGPHDGHSFFSQFCDALTGPGKIFACSAGNNGGDTIHLGKTFTAASNSVSTFVTFSDQLAADNQRTWLDVWGDSSKTFCLKFRLFNGAAATDSTVTICMANTSQDYALVGSDGDTCYISVSMAAPEYNGRPHAFLTFFSKTADNICLTATATSGSVNIWEGYVFPPTGYYGELKKLGYSFAVDGDTRMTSSDYSSSFSAISVGAYTSKSGFTNISGSSLGYPGAVVGKIAPFSSMGPTIDNRVKPDITGPGFALASAISSYDTSYSPGGTNYSSVISKVTLDGRDYQYAMAAGTSMSSPAVAGIIAMMLQLNPMLTPDSVKSIMRITALTDANTGVIPAAGSNTWGRGKINAYKALKYMDHLTSVKNTLDEEFLGCILYPNPSKGNFTISYSSKANELLSVEVYDITGRVISSQKWAVTTGSNNHNIAIGTAPAGIYFTKITTSNGRNKVIKTIVE